MVAEFEYRLAVGWLTKAAIEADDDYLLTNFPLQADQVSLFANPWGPPDDTTTYPTFTRYGQFSNTQQWSDGGVTFEWSLPYMTEGMIEYLEGLIWGGSGGLYANSAVQSEQVTVKTLKHIGEFGVYQLYANRPIPNRSYRRGSRGVEGYRIAFTAGVEVTV